MDNTALDKFVLLWGQLSPLQQRFAVAMQEYPTKKDAAEAINISPNTAYNWPKVVDEVIALITGDVALATMGIIRANAMKAAAVKVKGMDNEDDRISQAAATEVLDRVLGKAVQRGELTGEGGGPITIAFSWDNDD